MLHIFTCLLMAQYMRSPKFIWKIPSVSWFYKISPPNMTVLPLVSMKLQVGLPAPPTYACYYPGELAFWDLCTRAKHMVCGIPQTSVYLFKLLSLFKHHDTNKHLSLMPHESSQQKGEEKSILGFRHQWILFKRQQGFNVNFCQDCRTIN